MNTIKNSDSNKESANSDRTQKPDNLENSLIETEAKYRLLYENTPISYQSLNEEGVLIDVNPAWLSTLGYKKEEVVGHNFKDFLHPESCRHFEVNFPKFKKRGFVAGVTFKIRKKNSDFLDISFEGRIGYNPNGSIKQTYCVFHDITKAIHDEELIRQNEFIVSSSSDMIALIDKNFRYRIANKSYREAFGLNFDQIIGKTLAEVFGNEFFNAVIKPNAIKCLEGENVTYQDWFEFPNYDQKHYMDIRYYPYFNKENKVVGFVVNGRDITERKLAEEELTESLEREQLQANIVRNAPLAIAFGYPDGRLENCNKSFSQLTGYSESELRKIDWNKVLTPAKWNEHESKMLEKLSPENNYTQYEKEYIHKSGKIIPIELVVKANYDAQNKLIHFIGFIIDISEKKQAEIDLKESESRFKSLMKESPFVVEIYDMNGLQVSVNKAYEQLWSFPADTTVNKFNVLKSKEVVDTGLIKYVLQAYNGESVTVPEYVFNPTGETEAKGKGRVRWLSTKIYPLTNDAGKVKNIVIVHQDISEQKMAEEELLKHQENLEAVVRERTLELENKNKELDKTLKVFVGREIQIRELQNQIKALKGLS